MSGLRILVPVKRVIDYAVSLPVHSSASRELRLTASIGQASSQQGPDGRRDDRSQAQYEPL